MRQDTDVARMAAALRTPSLKYRSFGNEPVRNPPPAPPPAGDSAFGILEDALAGVSGLPADTVLGGEAPLPEEPARGAFAEPAAVAPQSYAAPQTKPAERMPVEAPPSHSYVSAAAAEPAYQPPLPTSAHPVIAPPAMAPPLVDPVPAPSIVAPSVAAPSGPAAPMRPAPVPAVAPVAHCAVVMPAPVPSAPQPEPARSDAPGSNLLQALLSSPPAGAAPQPVPVTAAAPRAARPVVPSLLETTSGWPPARLGGSTGSTLLDTLVGASMAPAAAHFSLLDALGDAMRGTAAEPSPRHWPAARVDIALSELLRRVAAGVRFARTAA
jgi:hypothetical protein